MVFLLYNKDNMYESPTFETIATEGPLTLRRYREFATVSVHEPSLQGYSGFGYLFQYISGQNRQGTKMKMTVPVINDLAKNEQTMEFVIPSIHQQAIPEPMYASMKIKHYPAQLVIAYTFSGYVPKEKMERIMEKMAAFASTHHLTLQGDPKIARYNGPYTLPFLRHNEIWLTVTATDNPGKLHTS